MNQANISNTYLFLQRYHALFKGFYDVALILNSLRDFIIGDIRISSSKDEFVLADIDIMVCLYKYSEFHYFSSIQ
jgi:hypothetical protein